jgi:hypothetical protein
MAAAGIKTLTPTKAQYKAPHAPGQFRSQLEVLVASELTARGVDWSYEVPVIFSDGRQCPYLPDFLINKASPDLELPKWVECKPQQFLYDLRDTLELTRRYGDKFSAPIELEGCDAQELKNREVQELWKPKRLAEITGESVLVIGGVGRVSTLTIQMNAKSIIFSRTNSFVNWKALQQAKERELRDAEYRILAAKRQAEYEAAAEARKQNEIKQRAILLTHVYKAYPRGSNKYVSECCDCGATVPEGIGNLRSLRFEDGSRRFFVLCPDCIA